MKPKIIEECRKAMYDAVWLEIDRDPQRPAVARVDIKTKAGDICVWCDRTGNTAVVSHKNNNNDSERLEEAIEGCVNYQDVMDDWLEENSQYADQDPMDAFEESRLDSLMAQLVWLHKFLLSLYAETLQRQGKGRTQNSFFKVI